MDSLMVDNYQCQEIINTDRVSYLDKILTNYYRKKWRGFNKIWNLFKKNNCHASLQVVNKYGALFNLNPNSYIDSHVIHSGYYESEVLEAILPLLDERAVFWDIGANFGLHAITAKFLQPQATVICIEPSSLMMAKLQENCLLNNLKIETVNVALSNSQKFQSLHLAQEGNPGMSTLKPWSKATYNNSMFCWCTEADNLVSECVIAKPTVIKLDVEGSELEVLLGMKNILNNNVLKAIVFEESYDLLEKTDSQIYEIIINSGFKIQMLARHENTKHNLENFIAIR